MDDFVNRWNGIKDEMFSSVEDPLKSKWWNKAWEIMLDPNFGPVVAKDMPEVEVALLLIELRNIHTGYEFMYWQYDYEPMWLDYWDATGLPLEKLVSYLKGIGFLADADVSEDEDTGPVRDAMHTYCWGKRQAIFDALIRHFEDETNLGMYMLGGKTHRNKNADQRIFDYACDQFDF